MNLPYLSTNLYNKAVPLKREIITLSHTIIRNLCSLLPVLKSNVITEATYLNQNSNGTIILFPLYATLLVS
jgi:hypothetical protein